MLPSSEALASECPNSFEDHDGKSVDDRHVVKFWSGAKKERPGTPAFCTRGSNFLACENGVYVYAGYGNRKRLLRFETSEALFQSLRVPHRVHEFSAEGLYGRISLEAFRRLGVPKDKAPNKVRHWEKKGMHGVVAKMRIGRLKKRGDVVRSLDGATVARYFWHVLLAKYTQNPLTLHALLDTEDAYLLEFVRGAAITTRRQKERWGGIVTNGVVVGCNQMGALHMRLRRSIRKAKRENGNVDPYVPRYEDILGEEWDDEEPLADKQRRISCQFGRAKKQ